MSEDRPNDLNVLRSVSLSSAIEREIEALILQGELAPGERLNEIRLATRLGTSRGPIREASRSLQAKGLVEIIRNRGVFIRKLTVKDVSDIYEIRAALFGQACWLFAERITDADIARLDEQIAAMNALTEQGDSKAYFAVNLEFHDTILDGADNPTLAVEYRGFVAKLRLFRATNLLPQENLEASNAEHGRIASALRARYPEGARAAGWDHVMNAKRRLMARLEGLPREAPADLAVRPAE
ncbi:MAG: GntR family transcriptional regulator [Pseudomonadota bacterium]